MTDWNPAASENEVEKSAACLKLTRTVLKVRVTAALLERISISRAVTVAQEPLMGKANKQDISCN